MSGELAAGLKLGKEYDFRVMDDLDEFKTQYMWPRDEIINEEEQFYADPDKVPESLNPFALSDLGLSIIAMLTPDDWLSYTNGQTYLSGVLTTRYSGYSQLFGLWEISARLPSATGAWPALWLLPTFENWPEGIPVLSEIDIMEAVGKVRKGIYSGSLHSNETGGMVHSDGNEVSTGADLVNEFHRYAIRWEPDFIVWYFDGVEVLRRRTPDDMQAEPRHLLMNFAVGGKWAEQPDPEQYPSSFDIEWVRIYESDYVPPVPEPKEITTCGDVLRILADGRAYTRRDAELSAAYMNEIANDL